MTTQSQMLTNVGTNVTKRRGLISSQNLQRTIALYVLMVGLGIIFMFPFFWTVSSSLKQVWELMTFPPTWLPETPQWQNYAYVLQKVPFLLWTWNSVFVVGLSTAGTVLSASIAGFSFARFYYRGRNVIFLITLATMMLPAQVTLIPQFVLFHKLGWVETLLPLWVPHWFGGGAFFIFLFRQFFMSLPRELDEAALIDGASYPRIFWSIILPLSGPVMATVAVISFIAGWNDFINPLIYVHTPDKYTLAVGLNYFRQLPDAAGAPTQHLLMAASVMVIAPVLVIFFAAQRYFVQGIVLSGIKG
ncbi:MAG: carbohydrate ABC transporter permease [Caldilineaceae bacterium]